MENQNLNNYNCNQPKKSHIGFFITILIILGITYGIWNAETGNKISLIIEKPNQKIIIIENEKDGFNDIPKRIGIGNTYNEANQKSVSTDQLIEYLFEYFYEQSNILFE